MANRRMTGALLLPIGLLAAAGANAYEFNVGETSASFVSLVTVGATMRMKDQNADLLGLPGTGGFTNLTQSANRGDANYNKYDLFAGFVKGNHELLLKFPDKWKFFARGTWLYDFAADKTKYAPLTHPAYVQAARDVRVLDLWVSKDVDVGGRVSRLRVGNQVVSWGESLFVAGGVNQTNGLDLMRFTQPGVPLKEVVQPAPMVSYSMSPARGVNLEAYYQFHWAPNRFIPPGTFFSASNYQGAGRVPFWASWDPYAGCHSQYRPASYPGALPGCYSDSDPRLITGTTAGAYAFPDLTGTVGYPQLPDVKPSNQGQWGVALHYKPPGKDIDLGLYAMRYHEKNQYFQYVPNAALASTYNLQWVHPSYRNMVGVSTNFKLWDWAWGLELSYRNKDPIQVDPFTGGADGLGGGTCADGGPSGPGHISRSWCDATRYQLHGTWWKVVSPSDPGGVLLRWLGAQASNVQGEAVWVKYPGVEHNSYKGLSLYADLSTDASTAKTHYGDASSLGFIAYFDLTYDSTLIPGWQIIPNITFTYGLKGDTPNANATWFQNNHAIAAALTFNQNPTIWQGSIVYTYYGGGSPTYVRNYYKDRSWLGFNLARNF